MLTAAQRLYDETVVFHTVLLGSKRRERNAAVNVWGLKRETIPARAGGVCGLWVPNAVCADLLQDVKADQLTKGDPRAGWGSVVVCCGKEAQVKGRADDRRSPVRLSDNGLNYHTVDNPFVAGVGPHDARRRNTIGRPSRTLFELVRVQHSKEK